ncbi:MAG: LacI family DNA-binding transcriptional regulator [Kiritimatiellae bacterium]|nr:LacI family DNA-binding transcriptional regulator [Kiritimatiellia bacterium]
MKPPGRITLKKLAEILELDVSSVSLALRNSPKISAATKRRIHELARQYCYSPNMAARQLRCSSPRLVGLVLPAMMNSLANPMAGRTIQVLAEKCTSMGIVFQILSAANLAGSPERAVSSMLPEAMFVWGDVPRMITEVPILHKRPMIVLDPSHPSYAGYSGNHVSIDNFSGGTEIARHFIGLKAARFLLIGVEANHLGHVARMKGAEREWLRQKPKTSLQRRMITELDDDALRKFAVGGSGAVFCANDHGALQLWHRFKRLGVRMPEDVRLAGFDGEEAALLAGITTVIFDWHKLAQTAWQKMLKLIQHADDRPVSGLIPVALHKGRTS